MIFGIGTDLVQVERIAATWERFGDHFVERLLMPEERAIFDPNKRPARFLAMRFAAKEAIAKALGTGFRNGVWIRDFGFMANAWGSPRCDSRRAAAPSPSGSARARGTSA